MGVPRFVGLSLFPRVVSLIRRPGRVKALTHLLVAVLLGDAPEGARMGHVRLKRGHQVLLGAGNAYRFAATRLGVLMQQTVLGDLSVQKWREICFT